MKKQEKRFYTYEQQISHLRGKGLIIDNEDIAMTYLKRYSYYALISGYKSIFKAEKNGPQIASSSWTPSGRKLGLPQPLRLRKQCQGMLQRVLLECSTPDSSSEGC